MTYPTFHPARLGDLPLAMSPEVFRENFPSEGDFIEFKQGASGRKVSDAVVAFSNLDGGVIFVGVADNGTPTGLDKPGETTAQVHHIIGETNDPGRYDV